MVRKGEKQNKTEAHDKTPDRLLKSMSLLSSAFDIQEILRMQVVQNIFDKKDIKKLLDVGCSGGIFLQYYLCLARTQSTKIPFYVGIDFEEKNINILKSFINSCSENVRKDLYAVQGNVVEVETFKNIYKEHGKFDVCIALEVIEHFDKKYAEQFIKSLHKMLNAGGYLILSTPVHFIEDEKMYWPGAHVHEFMFDEIHELLQNYFSIENVIGNHVNAVKLKKHMESNNSEMFNVYKQLRAKQISGNWINSVFAMAFPEICMNNIFICRK